MASFNPLLGGPPVTSGQARSSAADLDRNYGAAIVVDGTPVRVAMLGIAGAVVLFGLRVSGFRFNVGVSN